MYTFGSINKQQLHMWSVRLYLRWRLDESSLNLDKLQRFKSKKPHYFILNQ